MKARVPVIVTLLGSLPFAATLLTMPFGRDQGIYAYTGARILAGDVPYRDIFSFKPPSTALLHATALAIFGHSMTSIRAMDLVWTLATAATIAGIGTRWWQSRIAGAASGLAFTVIYCHFNYWTTAQTDGWATLPVALAVAMAFGDRRLAVVSGALLGVALVFKYTFVGYVPLVLGVWWWVDRKLAFHALLGMLATLAAAGLALLLSGGMGAFLRTQVDVTLPYTGLDPRVSAPKGSGTTAIWKNVRSIGDTWLVIGGLGALVLGWDIARGRARPERLALLGWWAAALLSLVVQKKYFQYHFLPVLAPLALVAGGVAAAAERGVQQRWNQEMPSALALLLLGFVFSSPFPNRWGYIAGTLAGDDTIHTYWRTRSFVTPDTSLRDNLDMAAWVDTNTAPDDPVFLWSYEPIVYFLADRRLVSRFLYHYPLVVPWAPPSYRDELIAAIEADPPKVVGVCDKDASPDVLGHRNTSWETFLAFPELSGWVARHCQPGPRVTRWHTFTCGEPK